MALRSPWRKFSHWKIFFLSKTLHKPKASTTSNKVAVLVGTSSPPPCVTSSKLSANSKERRPNAQRFIPNACSSSNSDRIELSWPNPVTVSRDCLKTWENSVTAFSVAPIPLRRLFACSSVALPAHATSMASVTSAVAFCTTCCAEGRINAAMASWIGEKFSHKHNAQTLNIRSEVSLRSLSNLASILRVLIRSRIPKLSYHEFWICFSNCCIMPLIPASFASKRDLKYSSKSSLQ
mmetsp:Transcript_54102/g.150449  ORF Transcript_54102/g.150449 Transcript_54102/m.150449 type:complete len:236 (-) Transcript_54102:802-1509(-)